jgi:DNA processing protein
VLVETVEDILCELGSMLQWEQARLPQTQPGERGHSAEIAGLDAQQAGLLAQIAYNPVTVDELSATLNISVEELFSGLMRLELEGLIERNAAGYVRTC